MKTKKIQYDIIEHEIIANIGKTSNTTLNLINYKPAIKHSLAIINKYHRRRFNKPHQLNYDYLKGIHQKALNSYCSCKTTQCNLLADVFRLLKVNKIRSNEDHFIVLSLEVNGIILKALVDSGASYNYISKQAYDHLQLSDEDSNLDRVSHSVQVANKTLLNSLGTATLDANLDGHLFNSKFTILESLSFDVILGMSFLKENRVIIDAEDGEIYFKTHLPQFQAKLSKTIEIPAHSNVFVTADSTILDNGTYVLNNTSTLGIKHGIYAGQGLVDINKSQLNVFLSNLTDKTKTIQART